MHAFCVCVCAWICMCAMYIICMLCMYICMYVYSMHDMYECIHICTFGMYACMHKYTLFVVCGMFACMYYVRATYMHTWGAWSICIHVCLACMRFVLCMCMVLVVYMYSCVLHI